MAMMHDDLRATPVRNLFAQFAVAIALFAGTIALYWPATTYEFIEFDDPLYVTEQPIVKKGLTVEGVKFALTSTQASNWHPITWLSHMLDCTLFKLNPAGHHATSIVIHALNAAIMLLLFARMTRLLLVSTLAAAMFAFHPLRIESVVWIAERKDVLSLLFGLFAIWSYVSFARKPAWWRYILVAFWFSVSLMCKPMLVTLPVALLLLDYWPLRRIGFADNGGNSANGVDRSSQHWSWGTARKLIIEKLPLLAISIVSSAITIWAQHLGGTIESLETRSITQRIANAIVAYSSYLGKTFWPVELSLLYPHPTNWPLWQVTASLGLLLAITLAAIVMARRHPYFIVGWLWFLGTLVPVIGLLQVGSQSMADRYTYVPHLGLLAAVCWLAIAAFGRIPAFTVGFLIVAALCMTTRASMRVWVDSEAVYTQALRVTEGNWVMHLNLAQVLADEGDLSRAQEHFTAAKKLRPELPQVHALSADFAARHGRIEHAIDGFREALRLRPNDIAIMNNLAWILATQANPLYRNATEALTLAEKANHITEHADPGLLDTLAAAYAANGRFDEARSTAQKALKLANETEQLELSAAIQAHLATFETGQPIREGRR
jgi:protein O-mannosyl-transferase